MEFKSKLEFKKTLKTARPILIISGLIFMFLTVMLWPSIFITVKAGEAGVLWLRFFGGTVVDKVYGEGLQVICPWDKMEIYNMRVQTTSKELEVLTTNGLKVVIHYTIRHQPEYDVLGVLHAKVGPEYVERIVVPEVEASIRQTAGNYESESLYSSQGAVVKKMVNDALDAVARRYVKVDNVNIRKVVLPDKITAAIENKLEQVEKVKMYQHLIEKEKKEAERRKIEADGLKVANQTVMPTLTPELLRWKGIEATALLASSTNAKVVVVGSGKDGLPLILGGDR